MLTKFSNKKLSNLSIRGQQKCDGSRMHSFHEALVHFVFENLDISQELLLSTTLGWLLMYGRGRCALHELKNLQHQCLVSKIMNSIPFRQRLWESFPTSFVGTPAWIAHYYYSGFCICLFSMSKLLNLLMQTI